jgi:hypothetical protein
MATASRGVTGGLRLDPLDEAAPEARAADTGVEPDDPQRRAARVPPEGQGTADQTAAIFDHQHEGAVLGEAGNEVGETPVLVRQALWQLGADDVEHLGQLVQ